MFLNVCVFIFFICLSYFKKCSRACNHNFSVINLLECTNFLTFMRLGCFTRKGPFLVIVNIFQLLLHVSNLLNRSLLFFLNQSLRLLWLLLFLVVRECRKNDNFFPIKAGGIGISRASSRSGMLWISILSNQGKYSSFSRESSATDIWSFALKSLRKLLFSFLSTASWSSKSSIHRLT